MTAPQGGGNGGGGGARCNVSDCSERESRVEYFGLEAAAAVILTASESCSNSVITV